MTHLAYESDPPEPSHDAAASRVLIIEETLVDGVVSDEETLHVTDREMARTPVP